MIRKPENYKNKISEMDVWELIQHGLFEEASSKADLEFAKTKDIFVLRNKMYALFQLSKYNECFDLGKKIVETTNGQTDSDFIFWGIAAWLMHNKQNAIEIWSNGEKSKYTDAAGGIEIQILLYFASVRTRDKALKSKTEDRLRKLLKSPQSANWPGSLGHFILGRISSEELYSAIDTGQLKERQSCQADFAVAVKHAEFDDDEAYRSTLTKAISHGANSYLEQFYYLAKGELNRTPPADYS